jgi:uncharacterized phiE125 gp8 family phage protein
MPLTLITAPAETPVTLAEARQHLRVTATSEDALITNLIGAAVEHSETFTSRAIVTQTWELSLDAFRGGEIELPKPNLQSVTSVKYIDLDGASQTVPAADYQVDTISEPGRIKLVPAASWPSVNEQLNAVTIRFIAGYGLAASVPFQIKAAILLLVQYHEQRDAKAEILQAAERLLWPYRMRF